MYILKEISKKLSSIGKNVYIVGGWTREKILGNDYNGDIDLATDALPFEVASVLKVASEIGKKYGTQVILEGGNSFEITTFRSDIGILNNRKPVEVIFTNSLEIDSARRDFTFNAIYFDIKNETFIDPQNGIKDIKDKKIRFVGDIRNRIEEDALRILRFIRFKNKYDFEVGEDNYFEIIKDNIFLLANISIERIKDELDKILLLENNINALKDLMEIGFFEIFLPEVYNLTKTPGGPKHHLEGNVWIHTLMALEELNNIFNNGFLISDKTGEIKNTFFSKEDKLDYLRTILLHDISKYDTYSFDNDGNIHYYDHELVGAKKFKIISEKFKFSKKSSDRIHYLIDNHIKIYKVIEMRDLKAKKFMMGKYFEDLLLVSTADNLGRIPAKHDGVNKLFDFYNKFLLELKDKKFYNGDEIIKMYPDLKGREVGEMLEVKNDEILLGIKNKKD